jgi:urea transporter
MHLCHLPPFTVAFNLVTMMVLVAITRGTVVFAHWKESSGGHDEDWTQLSAMFFVDSFFRGVGQLIFCPTTLGGGLITLGLIIGRQRDGLFALSGSIIGCLAALFVCRVPYTSRVAVRSGLYGYNPSAVGIVMGGGRFYCANAGAGFIAFLGSVLCVFIQVSIEAVFVIEDTNLPTLTFPFFIASWIMMMSQSQWLESLEDRDENNENIAPVRKKVARLSKQMRKKLVKRASEKMQDVRWSAGDQLHHYHDQLKRTLAGHSKKKTELSQEVLARQREAWERQIGLR